MEGLKHLSRTTVAAQSAAWKRRNMGVHEQPAKSVYHKAQGPVSCESWRQFVLMKQPFAIYEDTLQGLRKFNDGCGWAVIRHADACAMLHVEDVAKLIDETVFYDVAGRRCDNALKLWLEGFKCDRTWVHAYVVYILQEFLKITSPLDRG